jgi:hypothetical protein
MDQVSSELLSIARGKVQEAAQHAANVVNHYATNESWGTQRLDYLTQALTLLNYSHSLLSLAVNSAFDPPAAGPLSNSVFERRLEQAAKESATSLSAASPPA